MLLDIYWRLIYNCGFNVCVVSFKGIPGELGAVGQIGPRVRPIQHISIASVKQWDYITLRLEWSNLGTDIVSTIHHRESAEFLVKEVNSVQPVFKDPKESPDLLVPMDPRYGQESKRVSGCIAQDIPQSRSHTHKPYYTQEQTSVQQLCETWFVLYIGNLYYRPN